MPGFDRSVGQSTALADEVQTVEAALSDRAGNSSAMATLVAAVAHTVRNPLFVLSATLEAFETVPGFPPEAREYLDPLRQQVDKLETIMRGLLEYGRPLQIDAMPGRLGQALAKAISDCHPLAKRSGVGMVTLLGTEQARLPMDERLLAEAFRHLIENAIEHSPQGGTIRIEGETATLKGREWAECRILDKGPGFRPPDLARLFQPFSSRREGHSGLGLAISRRIVEGHGGQVTAGNSPDGGAWVRVCLPLLEGNDGR
jgi:signal transduction histidine kinase